MRSLTCILFFLFSALWVKAGINNDSINLIKNGNFELGNSDFSSDYSYSVLSVNPGEYSITKNPKRLNSEMNNPAYGDHTTGKGFFLISNADDQSGMAVWKSKVKIKPFSYYRFSVYFCNLYGTKATNGELLLSNFQLGNVTKGNDPNLKVTINKKVILQDERDIFQMFNWINAEGLWYSGSNSGEVEISIENLNSSSIGNDLALDDISLYLIKTMPDGYKEPIPQTEMSAEYREVEAQKNRPDPRQFFVLNNLYKGDSVTAGIRFIKQKPYVPPVFDSEKEQFRNILFEQSKANLTQEAIEVLNDLVSYLNKNPKTTIRLKGHTDNVGNPDLNLKLSEERANLVKSYLIENKIAAERIEIKSFGGTQPIQNSTNEEFYKLNRRVEIELIKH